MGGEGFWEVEEKSGTEKWQEMKERIRGLVKKKTVLNTSAAALENPSVIGSAATLEWEDRGAGLQNHTRWKISANSKG